MVKTDSPTKKYGGHIAASHEIPGPWTENWNGTGNTHRTFTEIKDPTTFEEKLSFLRKKQTKPCEIDLLFVDFHLGKVGVVGEISRQVLRDAVFEVDPKISGGLIGYRGRGKTVRCKRANSVGLDF